MSIITNYLREKAVLYNTAIELVNACVKDLGARRKTVWDSFYYIRDSKNPIVFGVKQPVNISNGIGISEAELRQRHDIKFIIEKTAKELKKEMYVMEADFIKRCNLRTQSGYRQIIDSQEFSKYRGKASGIIYWSHPESMAKMIDEGILTSTSWK